ncbi:hypothetical protein D4740_02065 [Actinomyces sp. 2119]|uniref:Uncharacterized protein n=2 Tax=Actinomycetaceae TaxID=2049 RepID=A0ABM6Z5T5_9ACTO|nr:hypothetical protein D5R93_00380 [Actinomyces lilanjuaniae]RJF44063.1 hypothetical protein D4740_02065 [Actinomyces sp. 2119]
MEAEALIVAQRRDYARRNTIRSAPLLLAWGLAWLLGYTTLALAGDGGGIREGTSAAVDARAAYTVFVACLVAAGIFTAVYIALRSRGVRGTSGRQGVLYSGAWIGGMALTGVILGRLNSFLATVGTPEAGAVGALVSSAVPCLVVGVIFLVGAALWGDNVMGALGGWILAAAAVATVAGLPWAWWVMAVGGGGGMLLAAARDSLASRRIGSLDRDRC